MSYIILSHVRSSSSLLQFIDFFISLFAAAEQRTSIEWATRRICERATHFTSCRMSISASVTKHSFCRNGRRFRELWIDRFFFFSTRDRKKRKFENKPQHPRLLTVTTSTEQWQNAIANDRVKVSKETKNRVSYV